MPTGNQREKHARRSLWLHFFELAEIARVCTASVAEPQMRRAGRSRSSDRDGDGVERHWGDVMRPGQKDELGHLAALAADLEVVPWVQAALNAPPGCRPAVLVRVSPRAWGHVVVGAGWFWWLLPHWPIRPTTDVRGAANKITAALERLDERLKW